MAELLDELVKIVGPSAVLTGEAAHGRALSRWQRTGTPLAVVMPSSTAEVSAVLGAASRAAQTVVPWGGLTGLVDGAFAQDALAVSLERMNQIEAVDPINNTMTLEAGCILQTACEAAETLNLLLPLDIGARGSATIGGNISTNAGGNRVLRWGMARDNVLGLEAVLADGRVISSMNSLVKNNAGYDLKHLFIGTEGTLGLVTRAVLRLRPRPASQNTAFVAVDSFDALPRLLSRAGQALGGTLSAFEVMWEDCYQLLTTPPARGRPPLPYGRPYYVLIESMGADQAEDHDRFLAALTAALEDGEISDAAIAKSGAERLAMWAIRDDVSQTARNGPVFAFDVSLRISDMEAYVAQVRQALRARWGKSATLIVFGHLGDGNLHVIAGVGSKAPEDRLAVEMLVYEPLAALGGSISAEHGIGLQKRDFLALSRSPMEIALMRSLKSFLDPLNILNPGKIFSEPDA